MNDIKEVKHIIQKNILSILTEQKIARFRDMRPARVDSNLYSYHLKLLQKNRLIEKNAEGYSLSKSGQAFIVASSQNIKIVTMAVIQNGYGGVLMYQKIRQPFIEQWTLPFGKVHNDDTNIMAAAQREVREKIGPVSIDLRHAGDCYIRVRHEDRVKISTLAHVFYGTTELDLATDHLKWIKPHEIDALDAAPAIKEIIARTFFRDPYFFEEFSVDW